MARESKPQCVSTFQASTCVMVANALFSKTSHVTKPEINVREGIEMYKDIETGEVIHWGVII